MSISRQTLFWAGTLVLLFFLLHLLAGMLLPFVAGFMIAYLLLPIVARLTRWGVPRWVAALLALVLFILALVLLVVLLVPVIEVQTGQLARSAPAAVAYVREQVQLLLDRAQRDLPPEDLAKARDMAGSWTGSVLTWVAGLAQSILSRGIALANIITLLLITPLVAFFAMRDWDAIVAKLDSLLPRNHAATIREQARLIDSTISGYLHGQALVSLIVGIYYAVALSILGLQFAIILGIVIGIISFVPYLGEATGVVLAMGLGAMQFGSWPMVMIIAAIFLVGHLGSSDVLQPKLVGSRVHLHQIWIIFALLAFGELFGFLGLLLALPAAAVTGVLVRFAVSRYKASALYDPSKTKRKVGS